MNVCVIGGGASGTLCAIMLAKNGNTVTLYEKNDKIGKKLYITGKGRCNLTNATTGADFLNNVVNGSKFIFSAETRFNSSDTINLFKSYGVPLKIERGNRVFPVSDKSSDIIKALEHQLKINRVNVCYNSNVTSLIVEDSLAKGVVVNGQKAYFDAVVVATGGISYPATGSTGDGHKFALDAGHTVVDAVPSLVGISVTDADIFALQGLSLKNVKLSAYLNGKVVYKSDIGEMLFTEDGVSGPLVLSLSAYINRLPAKDITLSIDFKPALSYDQLMDRITREITELGAKQVSGLLQGLLPKSLTGVFANRLGFLESQKANQITKEQRANLAKLLKNFTLQVRSLEGFDRAVVTSGGVSTKQISPKDMQSKLVKHLYFIGEVLDIDALTGGFNLQLAFSTAVACASNLR